jgi:nudix-type nucleoside diphosphatase (YffH/AdpP family)
MVDGGDIPLPKLIEVKTLYEGWGRFLVARLRLQDGQDVNREIEDHGQAVAVLPYDAERRIALLVRQLRPPALLASGRVDMLEAPAGRLDSTDPEACARREAFEEVGVRLGGLEPVVTAWTMPSVSTETIHLFLAPFQLADQTGSGGGLLEEQEHITVETVPLHRLPDMIEAGELVDMKTLVLVLSLRHRRPDLFER